MNFDFTKTIINGLKFWTKELVEEKVTSIEEEITASETNSKTYIDEQISSSEESVKSYVDDVLMTTEDEVKNYTDEKIDEINIPEHTWESLPDKPFEEEITKDYLLEKTTFTLNSDTPTYIVSCDNRLRTSVTIEFNGKEYDILPMRHSYEVPSGELNMCVSHVGNIIYDSNIDKWNTSYEKDNGLPFLIVDDDTKWIIHAEEGIEHTISVFKKNITSLKKIDEKFMPDEYPKKEIIKHYIMEEQSANAEDARNGMTEASGIVIINKEELKKISNLINEGKTLEIPTLYGVFDGNISEESVYSIEENGDYRISWGDFFGAHIWWHAETETWDFGFTSPTQGCHVVSLYYEEEVITKIDEDIIPDAFVKKQNLAGYKECGKTYTIKLNQNNSYNVLNENDRKYEAFYLGSVDDIPVEDFFDYCNYYGETKAYYISYGENGATFTEHGSSGDVYFIHPWMIENSDNNSITINYYTFTMPGVYLSARCNDAHNKTITITPTWYTTLSKMYMPWDVVYVDYMYEEISYSEDNIKSYVDEQIGNIDIPDIPEQVQSNLSETDSTNISYVNGVVQQKHLPEGYPYEEEREIVRRVTLDATGPASAAATDLAVAKRIYEHPELATVFYNGEECKWLGTYDDNDSSVTEFNFGVDDELKIEVKIDKTDGVPNGWIRVEYHRDYVESVDIEISDTEVVTHHINHKFLPEGYPYGDKLIPIAENKEITTKETVPNGTIAAGEDNVLVENKKYCVVFDGVEYDNLICQKSSNKFYLGSPQPLTDSSSYPFCIWTNYNLDRDIRIDTKEFGTYIVSLHYYEDVPMDERYIPESLKQPSNLSETDSTSKTYVDGVLQNRHLPNGYPHIEKMETEIFPATTKRMGGSKEPFFTLHYYTDVSTKINLVEGNKYTVIFDGTAYDCVCSSESVEGVGYLWLSTETGKYDDDFVVAVIDTSPNKTRLCAKGYNSSHAYKIYSIEETIVPVAEEFIPNTIARVSDIPEVPEQIQANLSETDSTSVSYVNGVVQQKHLPEGYPYEGTTTHVIEGNDNTEGLEYVVYDSSTFYRVANEPIPLEFLVGMVMSYNGTELEVSQELYDYTVEQSETEKSGIWGSEIFWFVYKDNATTTTGVPITFPKVGIYLDSKFISMSFTWKEPTIAPISEKFLPSTIATKPYVDTAVANLVNAAPETLDTLGELATAFQENKEVVDALDSAITTKQDKITDTLILTDAVTGSRYKVQIQNGQLVSFPVE